MTWEGLEARRQAWPRRIRPLACTFAKSVAAFTRAINKSMQYATENPDAARATIPQFSQIPQEVANEIRLPLWPVPIDTAKVEELADYAVQYGVIEEAPTIDELIWEGAETR